MRIFDHLSRPMWLLLWLLLSLINAPVHAASCPLSPDLLSTDLEYKVTSKDDNITRIATAQVTRLNNLGAEKRPIVVQMPGWGGNGDVPAVCNAQSLMFANHGYVVLDIGLHQTNSGQWYSDLAESAEAALVVLCGKAYADCGAIVITGESYGGTQTHPVIRYLQASGGIFDSSNSANAGQSDLKALENRK